LSPSSRVAGQPPSTARPQGLALGLLALAFAIVGAACGPDTGQQTAAVACPTALIRGTLEVLGTDIGLFDTDSRHLLVVWPYGYSTREVDGQLSVVDPAGGVVAGVSDSVEIPGGELRVGEWHACGNPIVRHIVLP
jgi:hypothetical protein